MKERLSLLKNFIEQNKPVILFLGGFVFDLFTLDRIDYSITLFQQLLFLVAAYFLIYYRVRKEEEIPPPHYPKIDMVLKYHTEIFHFIIGSLLSAYTIFYFLSSSFLSSLTFVMTLSILLILNEHPSIQKRGTTLRLTLLQVCTISYFVYVVPIIFQRVSGLIFFLSIILSLVPGYFLFRILYKKNFINIAKKLKPVFITSFVFLLFYFFSLIPPIPISLKKVAIYTHVEKKENNTYYAETRNPTWKFWNSGDQNFYYQEGDFVYLFFSIFAPTKFEDNVFIEWQLYAQKKGWLKSDLFEVSITGGREKGYRGFTYKKNIIPGSWRVIIRSSDQREIGRIKFEVQKALEVPSTRELTL